MGWSFGTELALKWGHDPTVQGAILLSPPLHRATDADLDAWAEFGRPLVALVPEYDDYLRPDEARKRFAACRTPGDRRPQRQAPVVGEPYVRIVLNEIVKRVAPRRTPTEWTALRENNCFSHGPRRIRGSTPHKRQGPVQRTGPQLLQAARATREDYSCHQSSSSALPLLLDAATGCF